MDEGTNTGRVISGATTLIGAGVSWADQLEQVLRIAGSLVALISGLVFLGFTLADRINKTRNKKNKHENKKH
jgi:class 3 adenylate cyclase